MDAFQVRRVVLAVIHFEPAVFAVGGFDEQPGAVVAIRRGGVVATELLFAQNQRNFALRCNFCDDLVAVNTVKQFGGDGAVFGGLVAVFMPLAVIGAVEAEIVEGLCGGFFVAVLLDAPFFTHREVVGAGIVVVAVKVAVAGDGEVGGQDPGCCRKRAGRRFFG